MRLETKGERGPGNQVLNTSFFLFLKTFSVRNRALSTLSLVPIFLCCSSSSFLKSFGEKINLKVVNANKGMGCATNCILDIRGGEVLITTVFS